MKRIMTLISLGALITLLYGCAATHTMINKRNLDVQTKMSETIFLDPVELEQKTVFIQIRNTSGYHQLNLEQQLARGLMDNGYTVVKSPNAAHYLIQANILQVGKADLRESSDALEQGFGGAFVGLGVGSIATDHGRTIATAGLLGAAVNVAASALVKDNVYTIITDLQISERAIEGTVTEEFNAKLKQGSATTKNLRSNGASDWKRYQTRIISTANKVNLKIEDAIPELVAGLSHSISGIL